MNTIDTDNLEEMERAHYADNRVELANLLDMIVDAKGDTEYTKKMLDNAEEEIDSLTKKLFLVFEMVEDADNLEKLQKFIARIEVNLIMSGVKP
jgi:glycogen debranching enzyme